MSRFFCFAAASDTCAFGFDILHVMLGRYRQVPLEEELVNTGSYIRCADDILFGSEPVEALFGYIVSLRL